MNTNALIDALQWRYATKQFDPTKKIPTETWEKIEESLVLTPSSFGLQPWQFIVVTSDDIKKQLLPHSWNQAQVTDCSHHVVFTAPTSMGKEEVDHLMKTTAEARGQNIEDLQQYRDMMLGFIEKMTPEQITAWASKQSYIALGQLMLTAALLKIDACPMEGIDPAEYDRILGLEERGLKSIVSCALGYRSSEDKYASAAKIRYTRDSVFTHI